MGGAEGWGTLNQLREERGAEREEGRRRVHRKHTPPLVMIICQGCAHFGGVDGELACWGWEWWRLGWGQGGQRGRRLEIGTA